MTLFTQNRLRTLTLGVPLAACMISSALGSSLISEYNPLTKTVEVNYIATDQHVHQFWFNGTWHTEDLTSGTGAPNAATGSAMVSEYDPIANTVEVNYIGTDQHVHTFWFNGTWHVSDLNAGTGAPNALAGSALTSEYNPIANVVEVNYVATDQHIHQFWFNGTWHVQDLNAFIKVSPISDINAPNADARSALSSEYNPISNLVEVNYVAIDQQVHQLFFNGGWQARDLDDLAWAPNPAAVSALASEFDRIAQTQEVNYIGTDQHVHQFWFDGGWNVTDLTAQAGAPNAAAGSALASLFDQSPSHNKDEVNYIGVDQRLYQLQFWGTSWHYADLTMQGAPYAAAGSALTAEYNPISEAGEVNYIGTDQHVHQVSFNGLWWHVLDLNADTGAPNAAP